MSIIDVPNDIWRCRSWEIEIPKDFDPFSLPAEELECRLHQRQLFLITLDSYFSLIIFNKNGNKEAAEARDLPRKKRKP